MAIGFPMAVLKIFVEEEFRMSEATFGSIVLPVALMMALLNVPMTRLGEKLGQPKWFRILTAIQEAMSPLAEHGRQR